MLQEFLDIGRANRLHDIAAGAKSGGLLNDRPRGVACHHDHRRFRAGLENSGQRFESAQDGHVDVEKQHRGLVGLGRANGFFTIGRLANDVEPQLCEQSLEQQTDRTVVVGDDRACLFAGGFGACSGLRGLGSWRSLG